MADRKLKEAMRKVLDLTFSDLAYNIGFHLKDADMGTHTVSWHETKKYGPIHKHVHRERQDPNENHFSGKLSDYSKRWIHSAGERAGKTAYIYEPANRSGGRIIFYNLELKDIDDVVFQPAESKPQGDPVSSIYEIRNDSPHKKTQEYEIEDEHSAESEKTFGWLIKQEFEIATRVSGGVGVTAEATARLETSVEARGDSRFTSRSSHRELLRGPRIVGPYAVLFSTVTEQLTRLTQPVIVTGKLDASVYIEANDPYARSDFSSIGQLFDCMRGFGGPDGRVAEWWGQPGNAISEDVMQKTFEPLLPVVRLELRPRDTVAIASKTDEHEEAYPGREEEYEAYKKKPDGGDDDLDF